MLLFSIVSLLLVQEIVVVMCDERKQIKIGCSLASVLLMVINVSSPGMLYNELNPIDVIALEEAAFRITQFSSKYNVSIVMERLGDTDSYEATKAGKLKQSPSIQTTIKQSAVLSMGV